MTYQLPTDADGVKYHGREYDDKGGIIAAGVDEHGNDKPILINTDGSLNMQSVVQELHDIKQRQQEILERLDDPIDTRVTGSRVECITVMDAVAITDTEPHQTDILTGGQLSKYKRLSLVSYNSLSTSLNLRLSYNTASLHQQTDLRVWSEERFEQISDIVVPTSPRGSVTLLSSHPFLKNWFTESPNPFIARGFRGIVQANSAPTSGSVSLYLIGEVM